MVLRALLRAGRSGIYLLANCFGFFRAEHLLAILNVAFANLQNYAHLACLLESHLLETMVCVTLNYVRFMAAWRLHTKTYL